MSEETVSAEVTETPEAKASGGSDTVLTEAAANTQASDEIAEETEETNEAEAKAEGSKDEASAEADGDDTEIDFEGMELPEDFELDKGLAEKAAPIFKEAGLNQDQAQKLVGLFAEIRAEEAGSAVSQWTETQKGWVDAIKSEWGGEYDSNVKLASKAVQLGGDELREALEITGAGNHPAIIKFFHRVGSAISEDGLVAGDAVVNQKAPIESRLYPSMKG